MLAWLNVTDGWGVKPDGGTLSDPVKKLRIVLVVVQQWCYLKGALAYRVSSFPKYFVFASLCSFICLQAVYQLSGPVCKATWNGCPSYSASYLHFTLCD